MALAAARTWVMAAQTTVQELDANVSGILLDSNAASCLAPDWALYAQAAALKLRDLEEVGRLQMPFGWRMMLVGQHFGFPRKEGTCAHQVELVPAGQPAARV